MEQAGLKGFEVNNWYALFAPAGTPKDIVARLNTEVVKILALAEVQKRLLESGIVAAPSSPEQLYRVESAIPELSGADAQIGNSDHLVIRPPAAAVAEYRTLMVVAVNVSSGS